MRARPFAALVVVVVLGCSGGGRTRDVAGDRDRRQRGGEPVADAGTAEDAAEVPHVLAQPTVAGKEARVFTHASAHALAIDATNLYYGDAENDGIYAMAKTGGEPVRLARHAPVAGAIALDSEAITWIASPGDAVLKLTLKNGGQPATLRDRGIFSDVTSVSGDIFITEVVGAGGALLRVTGPTAARIATFDGSPRAVVADGTHAYVFTSTRVLRTPHTKGELETLATGAGFSHPQVDAGFLYFVAEIDKVRAVVRLPKAGGAMKTIAADVRGPIECEGGEVLYFDAARPQVRAVRATGGPARVIVDNEMLATATSIVADPKTVYVATGTHESGAILAVDRR
jgi:hypothetical protein